MGGAPYSVHVMLADSVPVGFAFGPACRQWSIRIFESAAMLMDLPLLALDPDSYREPCQVGSWTWRGPTSPRGPPAAAGARATGSGSNSGSERPAGRGLAPRFAWNRGTPQVQGL